MVYAQTESVLKNEKHKILWDFEVQTDYQVQARRLDLVLINKEKKKKKENLTNSGLCFPGGPQSEKSKTMKREISNCCAQNNPQRLGKGGGRFRNQRMSGDH